MWFGSLVVRFKPVTQSSTISSYVSQTRLQSLLAWRRSLTFSIGFNAGEYPSCGLGQWRGAEIMGPVRLGAADRDQWIDPRASSAATAGPLAKPV